MIFSWQYLHTSLSCYQSKRYQRIKHARIQNWRGWFRGIIFVCFVLFVCLGFFCFCLFLGFFLNWRNSTYLGNLSDLPSISSPFLDPRMTSVNVYPHMCPDAMHHKATGFLLAWSKSPFPNKRITVPCIRKKLNIHCPAVFILHVRCDRILIKCQTYLFLIPSIT